jgi:hypothetical protein
MKSIYSFFIIVLPAFLGAQITLDSASVIPGIGTKVNYNIMDNASSFAGPGAAGAKVIWDFSKMTIGDSTDLEFEAVRGGFQADPGNTNLCEQYTGFNGARIQYKSTPSDLYIMGSRSGATQTSYGKDSLLKFKFPVAYNNTNTTGYYFDAGTRWRPNQRRGEYKTTVDGWGAILLPFGGLNEILRVKIEESYNDTSTLFGTETIIAYSSTTYEFWQKGTGSYVMSIKYADEDGDLDTVVAYRKQDQVIISPVDTSTEDTTSIIEIQTKKTLQLFPNPASTQIQVLAKDLASDAKVHITSVNGSIHEVLDYNTGEFDVSEFPHGIYFLMIEGEEYQPIRFVKQN